LWQYLEDGKSKGVTDRYLCRHRSPWYVQEIRPPSPYVCTYMGRGAKRDLPFRFILNHSRATVTNSYLILYPKKNLITALRTDPRLASRIWRTLNEIPAANMLDEGRIYGGGLHKIEPKELVKVSVPNLTALLTEASLLDEQQDLFSVGAL
jgi:adenine-specific DNA-methyltransferase